MGNVVDFGVNFSKSQIIADMVAEAERLGVKPGYIAKRQNGISIIKAGQLTRIDVPPGPSGFARKKALMQIQDLLEVAE